MASNVYFGILLLTVSIVGLHVSAETNCTQLSFLGQRTTLTCPDVCCGSMINRYCCSSGSGVDNTEDKSCTLNNLLDGTTTTLTCPSGCCGTEYTRYCCVSGVDNTEDKSCTLNNLLDGTTTTLTCPSGCCGTEYTRYCCVTTDTGRYLSDAAIIIIAVSCVLVVAVTVGVVICCVCYFKRKTPGSNAGRPGMMVSNGQAHWNAAFSPGLPVSYPMTPQQPMPSQGYNAPFSNVGPRTTLHPEVEAPTPANTSAAM